MIRRVHLVYPHGPAISCPETIGRHLAERLRERYEVVLHDWDEPYAIEPEAGDALVGHPHPIPWTVFRRSARRRGWARVVLLFPFHHADDAEQVAFVDPVLRRADVALAISGRHWFDTLPSSAVARWAPKLEQVDIAVDRAEFPPVKETFGAAGERRLLYIGHSHWTKNTGYLSHIAAELRDVEFGWIGGGPPIGGLVAYGPRDLSDPSALEIVARHDILVTVSRADANPCTVVEAMAWGLIPGCSPQSGYVEDDGVVHVPLDDAPAAAAVLREWLEAPTARLEDRRRANWRRLDEHFTWDRFAQQVVDALESPRRPEVERGGAARLLVRSLRSRHSPLLPRYLRPTARRLVQRRLR